MKRFITYLYGYKDGQKIKNTGHIRVDVRGQMLDMQVSIKDTELDTEKGKFYILVKKENVQEIFVDEFVLLNGQYTGRMCCNCYEQADVPFGLENVIGVCVRYESGSYMASCWKDGEEEIVAGGRLFEYETEVDSKEACETSVLIEALSEAALEPSETIETEDIEKEDEEAIDMLGESMVATEITELEEQELSLYETEPVYRKINLNEIYNLPSRYWHFSNNSFLMHGFWNYGYLVLKESVEENEKRMVLGVPGIFEQPEMVMASYFGFPEFQPLSSQVEQMEIGSECRLSEDIKNQPPQVGAFGCWFVSL